MAEDNDTTKDDDVKNDDVTDDSDVTTDDDVKTYSEDDYKKLQSESINRKGKIDKIEAELKKFKDDKLTEAEKKDARIKELETEKEEAVKSKKDADVETMIMGQASTKGFADLDVAMLVIKDELKLEDDITEVVIKKAVDKVAKDKAYLIGGTDTEINKGNRLGGGKPDSEKTGDEMLGDLLRNA